MSHFTEDYHKFFSTLAKNNKKEWFDNNRTIANNPDEFASIINNKMFKSKFGEIRGEKHKRIPPEFKEAAEKQPLLANKDFYVMANLDESFIINSKLTEMLMTYYFTVKPLLEFFTESINSLNSVK